jgi:gliding motility-associated-like protein
MRTGKSILLCVLVCLWNFIPLDGQNTGKNLDFRLGNFTNWVGYTWRYSAEHPEYNTNPVQGIVTRRQTIMSDTSAYDKNTGYALRKIPKGYKYSARLGDEIISSDALNSRCWEQSLRYTMTIDSSNALLILRFALVLQYISSHRQIDEPRFRLTLYDKQGNIIPDCSNYDVYATNNYVKGFKIYQLSGSSIPVMWRDWTTVGVNLIKYLGQTVTVEFMSADCAETYHYGYAYFVAECQPLYIKVKYCASDSEANLIAPEGFEKYKWTNSSGNILDTLRTLKVSTPQQNASYNCTLTSATGCVVWLQSSVIKYIPHGDFSSFMIDCKSNTVQMLNLSSTNHGSLLYNWYFENENTSVLKDPMYTFNTSGIHKVTMILINPPSACYDTLTKNIESFSPPLVGVTGDSTYCPGLSTYIKAYGAYDYTWSNGSKADSIEIKDPGGTFWLLGRSSTGCVSDTIYKTVCEYPYWELSRSGDSAICGTGNISLSVSGAVSYSWETGSTNDSIVVSAAGKYTVIATNARGCKKSEVFNVTAYSLPLTEFSISPDVLDRKHYTVECVSAAQPDVEYTWTMGDGSSYGSGSSFRHNYNINNDSLYYLITVIAKDIHNCTDTASKYIDVIPFIPNVFTPDGDGINDLFMPDFDLEIVDRSGIRIYKGEEGWDGRKNGRLADPDTYFYLVYYKNSKDEILTRKGYLTLVR